MMPDAVIDDAVVNVLRLQELRNPAALPDAVDGIQMIVVSVRLKLLGIDVLAERGVQIGGFQVMGGKRLPVRRALLPAGFLYAYVKSETRTFTTALTEEDLFSHERRRIHPAAGGPEDFYCFFPNRML